MEIMTPWPARYTLFSQKTITQGWGGGGSNKRAFEHIHEYNERQAREKRMQIFAVA